MFSGSLRRRESFEHMRELIPKSWKEMEDNTHDLRLPIRVTVDHGDGKVDRWLRCLLFSSRCASPDRWHETRRRIASLASATGGHDIIIGLIGNLPNMTISEHWQESKKSAIAYHQLQTEMMRMKAVSDIPYVPILPPQPAKSILDCIVRFTKSLVHQPPSIRPIPRLGLWQQCSSNPPMSIEAVLHVSTAFRSLAELAAVCKMVSSAPNPDISLGEDFVVEPSSQLPFDERMPQQRSAAQLKKLVNTLSHEELLDIVDFWREEWVLE